LSYAVVTLSPTALKPLAVQPFAPFSAPSANTVVPPAVTARLSAKKPLLPVLVSVAYRNRSPTVRPAYPARSKVAGSQPLLVPSMPLPSAGFVIDPGTALKPVPSSTSTYA
jgi:hypothetical protein